MPSNLSELMGLSGEKKPGASPPVPGSLPPSKGPSPLGNISNMMKQMPASGIKGMAGSVVSILIKAQEFLLGAYGTDSPEGKALLKSIKSLGSISKGQHTGDMSSVIQSLIAALPQNMQNVKPGDLTSALSELTGKGGGGEPAPAGAQPPPAPSGVGAMV